MFKGKQAILAAGLVGLSGAAAQAATGNFTAPLTNAFLSVDINGGPLSSSVAPTNGYNDNTSAGAFSADNYGVVWSPWGGNTYAGGDGTQLPSSQSSPNVDVSSISKTFTFNGPPTSDNSYFNPSFTGQTTLSSPVTATISESGTASSYAQAGGGATLNSRDRGSPSTANGVNDNDMFRDLLFASTSGSNVQGTNYVELSISGLTAGAKYTVAAYSYDSTGGHTTNWTAIAPTSQGGAIGFWDGTGDGTFTAPADEQGITWTAGTTPAPAVFTLTADGTGTVDLYGFGGNGVNSTQSADTTYIDGFQIATAVPEPTSLGVMAISALAMLRRRR